ncbi:MAG: acetyl-CoA carboxylase biotin carboxyl carrier protein [Gemmatimonadota bacterium]
MIDLDWVRRLIDMVDEAEIDSLEISRFGTRIRISKSPIVQLLDGAGGPVAPVADPPAATAGREAASAPPSSSPTAESGLVDVVSPMVGTFYRAPAPDAPPYVETGDTIRKGQTLCILEAMKLMNELEAEIGGTIREICADNAEPVEFGQVLFRVEPDGSS